MIDLHMHTTFSDGSITPAEVVQMAVDNGIKVIAITDHDNTRSYAEAVEAAQGKDLVVIPGIEINTYWQDYEVHILGYFINPDDELLQDVCQKHNQQRGVQMREMMALIKTHGNIGLDLDDIKETSREGGTLGRPHVARALVKKGGAANMSEAFRKYLLPKCPTYFRRQTVTPHEAVEAIYESGGVAVIAHPGDMPIIRDLAQDLMNYGLRGLEAYHKSHSPGEIEFHCSLAEELGLIVTGGTDFHGTVDAYPTALKRLHVPDWVFEKLKLEKQRIDMASIKAS
ncbi:MAG: PHP domain-containing protein [Cyanobacteria bacterium HKST-UBA06]|nr:PHP domain-containing protein [Cyanobacteria bacterium HKST-UBA05]MCA9799545.1 PHP domain-containing protein [Cyanobacteria bacterium HKST-UBA04]MCA9807595.1 PHP domain-containing protein [Cyanobacteria bacterium HKST-UBA06]MCA9842113.1 PHP domain-containing protein [Cyanobacteria bacterium HKST-UBA03]